MIIFDKDKTYSHDSRNIKPGDTYICLPKGDEYIKSALDNGAMDVIHMTRKEFAQFSNDYFGHPSKQCCLIGVTGTNGKTSVSFFIEQILKQFGNKVLVIGTMTGTLTTPESWDIVKQIKAHVDNGGTHVILEVSSHGIDQDRVHGLDFNIKCLTNISQDHLDYHKTFEHYKATKMRFMETYPGSSVFPDDIVEITEKDVPQLIGEFHLKNVGMAVKVCQLLMISTHQIMPSLKLLTAPDGRFELIDYGQGFNVIVDFAHTPDGLKHVLNDALALAKNNKQRLKVVFGCGGDRDQSKRKKMGQIAQQFTDNIVLTADNSRSELTSDIIRDIKEGIDHHEDVQVVLDRSEAISKSIMDAKKEDVIVIAGKGHEQYQVEIWIFILV